MKSPLLTSSSNFGKYLPKTKQTSNKSSSSSQKQDSDKIISSIINLKQNYVHESPFVSCRFDNLGNKLYLVDNKHTLIYLNLQDNSFSTLKNTNRVTNFTIDDNNSLSLLYVSPKSQLFNVSFDQKKPQKLLNLNMSKILAFERNYMREMLLVLDYKLLFLYDLTKKADNSYKKIRSLKAGTNEVFTNACFGCKNRFIILAVKNIQIRIVQIMNLKVIHQIKLPFQVLDLKIEQSYDSKRIAIYGNCNIIFFIVLSEGGNDGYAYQLIEIPFLKSITQLKFTYENDILILGSDQILYGIIPQNMDAAIPLFNYEYQIRMMAFDISLDSKKIAIVSNRNVYQLCMKKGLRDTLQQKKSYKQIQYRINGFEGYQETELYQNSKSHNFGDMKEIREDVLQEQHQSRQFQYEDEDEQSDEQEQEKYDQDGSSSPQIHLNSAAQSKIKTYPKFVQNSIPLNPAVIELKGLENSSKKQVSYVFTHLSSRYRDVCLGQNSNIVKLIAKLHSKFKGSYLNCLGLLDMIFSNISTQWQKLDHYTLVLCPEIISIVQKRFELNFGQFFRDLLVTLCMDYLNEQNWVKLINWIVAKHENSHSLPVFSIGLLKEILKIVMEDVSSHKKWELLVSPNNQLTALGLSFESVMENVGKIYSESKFDHFFQKEEDNMIRITRTGKFKELQVKKEDERIDCEREPGQNSQRLQKLIEKQQIIRGQLSRIQRSKPY